MADVYTLGLALDTTEAQAGAKDFVKAVETAVRAAKALVGETVAAEPKVEALGHKVTQTSSSLAALAKQFGLARGQLRDFINIGVTVFAGDILAKVLGFNSVMSLVTETTRFAADTIVKLGLALRNELFPELVVQEAKLKAVAENWARVREEFKAYEDDLKKSEKSVELGGVTINYAGLGDSDTQKARGLLIAAEAKVAEYDRLIKVASAYSSRRRFQEDQRADPQLADQATKARKEYIDSIIAEVRALQLRQAAEDEAAATKARDIALERERQDLYKAKFALMEKYTQRYIAARAAAGAESDDAVGPRFDGSGGFPSVDFAQMFPGLGPDTSFWQGPDRPYVREKYAEGYKFDRNNTTFGSAAVNAMRDGFEALAKQIPRATTALSEYVRKQQEAAEEARKLQLASDIGNRLAYGFEEAIFSGQKLSDLLRQLALDIARITFRNMVTNRIGDYLTNGLSGKGWGLGGGGSSSGSTFPGFEGESAAGGGDGFAGGVTSGGFRLRGSRFSNRQRRENLVRGF